MRKNHMKNTSGIVFFFLDMSPAFQVSTINIIHERHFSKFSKKKSIKSLTDLSCSKRSVKVNSRTRVKKRQFFSVCYDYVHSLRPVTILQAVGALIVGYLSISPGWRSILHFKVLWSVLSVYVSYGCGMLVNDLIDASTDSLHEDKQKRAVACGRITKSSGWLYLAVLSASSLAFGVAVGPRFFLWTLSNLLIMFAYAVHLQKIILVKNFICGWLAVSPLVGASMISTDLIPMDTIHKLWSLATVGFPMQVSREILKDIEDVHVDYGVKQTLPIVLGKRTAHSIAYTIVAMNTLTLFLLPSYRRMFKSRLHLFPAGLVVSSIMTITASLMSLADGQRMLKKSIFVVLTSMIASLMLNS